MPVGIDIGSTMTKMAIQSGGEVTYQILPTIRFLSSGDVNRFEGEAVVSTGYGRHRVQASEVIPEIRAHVLGALKQVDTGDFTLLDIGGQDFKIIKVRGRVIDDFTMNDKCAAGTGRFLERMAQQLDMTLESMGAHWEYPAEISSVCTVFAETEVVTKLMDGATQEQLAAGVNWSLYLRLKPYLLRHRGPPLVLSGGGTTLPALKNILESEGFEIIKLTMPLHNGAIGCLERAKKLDAA